MYSEKPESLKPPKHRKHRATVGDAAASPPLVLNCTVNHVPYRSNIRREPAAAEGLVKAGNATFERAKHSTPAEAQPLVIESINAYRSALAKDPYDADATTRLAVAYDKVLYQGCALALLRRLQLLSTHPDFQIAADRNKRSVRDNTGWFERYRDEALKVIP